MDSVEKSPPMWKMFQICWKRFKSFEEWTIGGGLGGSSAGNPHHARLLSSTPFYFFNYKNSRKKCEKILKKCEKNPMEMPKNINVQS